MYIANRLAEHESGISAWRLPAEHPVRAVISSASYGTFAGLGDPPELGSFARLEHEMNQIVSTAAEAQRWGFAGSLQDRLEIRKFMSSASWTGTQFREATFVKSNKCNLFALDVGWRCGFRVPLWLIDYGDKKKPHIRYSYPLANSLTSFAERVSAKGGEELLGTDGTRWGWVETARPYAEINDYIQQGWVYLIAGWRKSGTGHVGIVRKITNLSTDTGGQISDITYDGWEATHNRAELLSGRRWRISDCKTGANSLQSFCRIHIIGLDWERNPGSRGVRVGLVNKHTLG